jgi:hypothetical protein
LYAAELDDNNVVVRVIVGDADWATKNIGGTWVNTTEKVGISFTFENGEFIRPAFNDPTVNLTNLENLDEDVIDPEETVMELDAD